VKRLPGGDPGPSPGGQLLGHVVPGRLAGGAPEAHVEMGPVLLAVLAVAPGSPTGPVRFGERPEQGVSGQGEQTAAEGVAGRGSRN
jgi:hypothetical protein